MVEDARLHYQMFAGGIAYPVVAALVKARIADKLLAGPQTIEELVHSTTLNSERLYRYLRFVTHQGFFSYDEGTKKWSNNEKSTLLTSNISHGIWEFYGSWFVVEHFAFSYQTLNSEGDPRVHRGLKPAFEAFAENQEALETFQRGMTAFSFLNKDEILDRFEIGQSKSILDVGGADGTLLINILNKHPGTSGAILDRPEVGQFANANIEKHGFQERIKYHGGSFFEEIPQGHDTILMKKILHDWPDDKCLEILKNCRKALNAGGRLVIFDFVVDKNDPKYGPVLVADQAMLHTLNAKERSKEQFEGLFGETGFRLTKIVTLTLMDIVEAEAI